MTDNFSGPSTKKILVDMEALLDFRVGALMLIDPKRSAERAFAYTSQPGYYTRTSDTLDDPVYGKISKETIYKIIERHYVDVMRLSPVTKLPGELFNMAMYFVRNAADGAEVVLPKFEVVCNSLTSVNLSVEEQEGLNKALRDCMVNLVDISFSKSTLMCHRPKDILKNYAAMVIYRHSQWFETYAETLKETHPNPNLCVYTPRLFMGKEDDKASWRLLKKHKVDPLKQWEAFMRVCLARLDLMPPSLVSANTPVNLAEYDTFWHHKANVDKSVATKG